jgi:hypothetical protein
MDAGTFSSGKVVVRGAGVEIVCGAGVEIVFGAIAARPAFCSCVVGALRLTTLIVFFGVLNCVAGLRGSIRA